MIPRLLARKVSAYARRYPVVTITGPRQSGKTTLCKALFPRKHYLSLEDLDVRARAREDPRGFLESCLTRGAIVDEIQRVPELLSYLQTLVDRQTRPGLFILTGSQNLALLDSIAQTLAGRTALATLLPFSYAELYTPSSTVPLNRLLYAGFYPRIHDRKLNPTEALSFYVSTYLERDVRSLANVHNLTQFERFVKLCAGRTAQALNVSALGSDCGISHNTARGWLSVLEASYLIHLARPHHRNFRKRLVKAPKLYFTDVGLAAYLLDITHERELASHPLRGALFETFVASEILKHRLNRGRAGRLYYFRDNSGHEVDLILDEGRRVIPVESQVGQTVVGDSLRGLAYYAKLSPVSGRQGRLIYGGRESYRRGHMTVVSYRAIAQHLP
jgi:predicted AAA+ superfamily ATPase